MITKNNSFALAIKVIDTNMNGKIRQNDIDRTQRSWKTKTTGKLRPANINFVWYNERKKDCSSKKLLKDTGVSITASLTAFRLKKLANSIETFGFRNMW